MFDSSSSNKELLSSVMNIFLYRNSNRQQIEEYSLFVTKGHKWLYMLLNWCIWWFQADAVPYSLLQRWQKSWSHRRMTYIAFVCRFQCLVSKFKSIIQSDIFYHLYTWFWWYLPLNDSLYCAVLTLYYILQNMVDCNTLRRTNTLESIGKLARIACNSMKNRW